MYFGRSIFQSVVERLDTEKAQADSEPLVTRQPRMNASFVFDTATDTSRDLDAQEADAHQLFSAYDLNDEESVASEPLPEEAMPQDDAAVPDEADETAEVSIKDFTYLSKSSHEDVERELALSTIVDISVLQAKRRQFARDNHPDTVPSIWRNEASLRMTAANLLIDQAVKDLTMRAKLGL